MATVKLNQIVAVLGGKKTSARKDLDQGYKDIQKSAPLAGLSRTYAPKDDAGDKLPSENVLVQLKAGEILKNVTNSLADLFDVTLTQETGNTAAFADVVVDGNVILAGVPLTYLLFLEKQLVDIGTFISKLPRLDPSDNWTYNENAAVYASDTEQRERITKVSVPLVLAQATDKHPAQVQLVTEDHVQGYWSITKFSGALPATRINQLEQRVEALKNAVKFAREEANSLVVNQLEAGKSVFNYLLAD